MEQVRIDIQGMSCGHCVAAVKRALDGLNGIESSEVEIGSAVVRYDPAAVTPAQITDAVEEEGYTASLGAS